MKIQCSCGARYELDVIPEMAREPVRFVCPACGVDASEFVNGMVRRELGLETPAPAVPRPVARIVSYAPASPPPSAAPSVPVAAAAPACPKHPGQTAAEQCRVCGKPICPQCMRLFGYVCSPRCKAKAETAGVRLPVYAGLGSQVDARHWRKIAGVGWGVAVLILGLLGFWFWYAWIGSRPHVTFSVRFPDLVHSGQSAVVAPDQLIVIRGGLLARYNLETKAEAWSKQLIDSKAIEQAAAVYLEAERAEAQRQAMTDPDHPRPIPGPDRLQAQMERAAAEALQLRVVGQNIWVGSPGKLTRYDYATGRVVKEIAAPGGLIPHGSELLAFDEEIPAKPRVTHIDLASGEAKDELLGSGVADASSRGADSNAVSRTTAPAGAGKGLTGLPLAPSGREAGKALDPGKVASQAQHLALPARIALPVILANSQYQERALAEADSTPAVASTSPHLTPMGMVSLVPAREGFLRFTARVVERKIVAHSAMKAAPANSVLNSTLTVAKTSEAANEILNEMQRSRGGDVVEEDQSRYQVNVQPAGGAGGWTGEVVGPPALFPLETVTVVAGGRSIVVLDRSLRPLWEARLNYSLSPGGGGWSEESSAVGRGPCVEHQGSLLVFDQGVLTAFDLASGKVRWGLPSVGIAGLFFDNQGMLYVNTTSAGLDRIKYSRQIDITRSPSNVALKIDPRTGKILWEAHPGGLISYVSGKFIYTVDALVPEDEDPDAPSLPVTGFEPTPHFTIKRLDPATGRQLWEWPEDRPPLDIRFDANNVYIVLRKEVEVLRFVAF